MDHLTITFKYPEMLITAEMKIGEPQPLQNDDVKMSINMSVEGKVSDAPSWLEKQYHCLSSSPSLKQTSFTSFHSKSVSKLMPFLAIGLYGSFGTLNHWLGMNLSEITCTNPIQVSIELVGWPENEWKWKGQRSMDGYTGDQVWPWMMVHNSATATCFSCVTLNDKHDTFGVSILSLRAGHHVSKDSATTTRALQRDALAAVSKAREYVNTLWDLLQSHLSSLANEDCNENYHENCSDHDHHRNNYRNIDYYSDHHNDYHEYDLDDLDIKERVDHMNMTFVLVPKSDPSWHRDTWHVSPDGYMWLSESWFSSSIDHLSTEEILPWRLVKWMLKLWAWFIWLYDLHMPRYSPDMSSQWMIDGGVLVIWEQLMRKTFGGNEVDWWFMMESQRYLVSSDWMSVHHPCQHIEAAEQWSRRRHTTGQKGESNDMEDEKDKEQDKEKETWSPRVWGTSWLHLAQSALPSVLTRSWVQSGDVLPRWIADSPLSLVTKADLQTWWYQVKSHMAMRYLYSTLGDTMLVEMLPHLNWHGKGAYKGVYQQFFEEAIFTNPHLDIVRQQLVEHSRACSVPHYCAWLLYQSSSNSIQMTLFQNLADLHRIPIQDKLTHNSHSTTWQQLWQDRHDDVMSEAKGISIDVLMMEHVNPLDYKSDDPNAKVPPYLEHHQTIDWRGEHMLKHHHSKNHNNQKDPVSRWDTSFHCQTWSMAQEKKIERNRKRKAVDEDDVSITAVLDREGYIRMEWAEFDVTQQLLRPVQVICTTNAKKSKNDEMRVSFFLMALVKSNSLEQQWMALHRIRQVAELQTLPKVLNRILTYAATSSTMFWRIRAMAYYVMAEVSVRFIPVEPAHWLPRVIRWFKDQVAQHVRHIQKKSSSAMVSSQLLPHVIHAASVLDQSIFLADASAIKAWYQWWIDMSIDAEWYQSHHRSEKDGTDMTRSVNSAWCSLRWLNAPAELRSEMFSHWEHKWQIRMIKTMDEQKQWIELTCFLLLQFNGSNQHKEWCELAHQRLRMSYQSAEHHELAAYSFLAYAWLTIHDSSKKLDPFSDLLELSRQVRAHQVSAFQLYRCLHYWYDMWSTLDWPTLASSRTSDLTNSIFRKQGSVIGVWSTETRNEALAWLRTPLNQKQWQPIAEKISVELSYVDGEFGDQIRNLWLEFLILVEETLESRRYKWLWYQH